MASTSAAIRMHDSTRMYKQVAPCACSDVLDHARSCQVMPRLASSMRMGGASAYLPVCVPAPPICSGPFRLALPLALCLLCQIINVGSPPTSFPTATPLSSTVPQNASWLTPPSNAPSCAPPVHDGQGQGSTTPVRTREMSKVQVLWQVGLCYLVKGHSLFDLRI